jgi:hypothetical protein
MRPSRLKAEGEHHLLHLQVAILLCTVMCFFSIEKFNEKISRSVAIGCIAFVSGLFNQNKAMAIRK